MFQDYRGQQSVQEWERLNAPPSPEIPAGVSNSGGVQTYTDFTNRRNQMNPVDSRFAAIVYAVSGVIQDSNGFYIVSKYDQWFGTGTNQIQCQMRLNSPAVLNVGDIVWCESYGTTNGSPDTSDNGYLLLQPLVSQASNTLTLIKITALSGGRANYYPATVCTQDSTTAVITDTMTPCYYLNANLTIPIQSEYYWCPTVGPYTTGSTTMVYGHDERYQGVEINTTGPVVLEPNLNLIAGSGVTLTIADNAGNRSADVTISGGGGIEIGTIDDPTDAVFTSGPHPIVDGIAVATGVKITGTDYTTGLFVDYTGGPTDYRILGMNRCTDIIGGAIICDTNIYQIIGAGDKAINGGLWASQPFNMSVGALTPNGIALTNAYFYGQASSNNDYCVGCTNNIVPNFGTTGVNGFCITGLVGSGAGATPAAPLSADYSAYNYNIAAFYLNQSSNYATLIMGSQQTPGSPQAAWNCEWDTFNTTVAGLAGTITQWTNYSLADGANTNCYMQLGFNLLNLSGDTAGLGGFPAPGQPCYAVTNLLGVWDTDFEGNIFSGGICTTCADFAFVNAAYVAAGGGGVLPGSLPATLVAIWQALNGLGAPPW